MVKAAHTSLVVAEEAHRPVVAEEAHKPVVEGVEHRLAAVEVVGRTSPAEEARTKEDSQVHTRQHAPDWEVRRQHQRQSRQRV